MRSQETPLAVLINDYRVACEAKLSPRSVVVYDRALRQLDRELEHPRLRDLTVERAALVIARKRKTSASNARLMAAVAKAFSSWLWKTGKTKEHRLEHLGVPEFNGRRRSFPDPDFRAILRALSALPNRTRKRDRALVLLALGSGLRSNELRTLNIDDAHITRPISESWALIRWETSKSKNERRVRIAEDAAAAIHDYIASDRPSVEGPLFLTEEGKAYSYEGWGKMFGRIADRLEDAGVKGFNAHRCRHQWATMAARTGSTHAELAQEGGWRRGSKVPSRYIDEIPFEDIQRKASPMTAFLRRVS